VRKILAGFAIFVIAVFALGVSVWVPMHNDDRITHQSEFRRINPEGWEKAQPLVKTRLAELARHYHATAQKTSTASIVFIGGIPRAGFYRKGGEGREAGT